jgi:hypothetical protein
MIIPPPTPISEPKVPAPRPIAMRIATVVAGSSNDSAFLYGARVITGEGKNRLPLLYSFNAPILKNA